MSSSFSTRLLLLGLIQDLQKQAVALGLSRTASALEVTGHVATEEVADYAPPALDGARPAEGEEDGAAD